MFYHNLSCPTEERGNMGLFQRSTSASRTRQKVPYSRSLKVTACQRSGEAQTAPRLVYPAPRFRVAGSPRPLKSSILFRN